MNRWDAAHDGAIYRDILSLESEALSIYALESYAKLVDSTIQDELMRNLVLSHADIARELEIPVIGIGAGVDCDGQVLVLYDMLGITQGKPPSFVKNFLAGRDSIPAALQAYVEAVKNCEFPGPEHSFA